MCWGVARIQCIGIARLSHAQVGSSSACPTLALCFTTVSTTNMQEIPPKFMSSPVTVGMRIYKSSLDYCANHACFKTRCSNGIIVSGSYPSAIYAH